MKMWIVGFALLFIIALQPAETNAQGCSMCTKTASQLGDKGARGLNNGILYLAGIPLTLLGAIGFFWYRQTKGNHS